VRIKDTYHACSIVEGFDGQEHDSATHLRAWAYLIKTRACWNLQGSYGRTATELIRMGYISETGRINWQYINATIDNAAQELGYA
jgi:hypothetical protein